MYFFAFLGLRKLAGRREATAGEGLGSESHDNDDKSVNEMVRR
jgi:hypothetical protein